MLSTLFGKKLVALVLLAFPVFIFFPFKILLPALLKTVSTCDGTKELPVIKSKYKSAEFPKD